jgi:glycosyltransferase involved in cell wall biosynthesis
MVCPQFRPMIGGYERAAERLAMALADRAHDVTVVAERREASWAPREQLGRVALRRLRVVNRPGLHVLTGVVALAAHLLAYGRRFDVIHVHQYGWAAAVSITIGHLLRRPVVLKLTGTDESGISNALRRGRVAVLLAGIHRRVDACLAPSERAAQEADEFGIPCERIHRIANGVDTNQARPLAAEARAALRRKLGIGGEVVALYVGRLSNEKNPVGLLEAWQQLGPPDGAVLVVAGDGPAREAVGARAAACGSSVRLLGFVTEPLEWYQLADLFVLPSIREGLSNSFLEALACGLPVVSTPVSGSEDIFASAEVGVLVERADVPSLARGIALLLGDPARRARCAEAARRIAVDRFSLDHVVEKVEALYRVLAASGPMVRKKSAR